MAGCSQYVIQIMATQTRFDLNFALQMWRQELMAQRNLLPDARRELESHLRDAIAGYQQRGLGDGEAFQLARERVGQLRLIGKEFKKVGAIYWNRPMAIAAWGIFVISLFLPAYAAIGMWPGYKCAWAILPWHIDGFPSRQSPTFILDWLSFVNWHSLNFANLLIIVSPISLCWFGRNAKMIRWFRHLTLAAVILVSWFYLDELIHNDGQDCSFGCYVWILSFVLLYLSVLPVFTPARNQRASKNA